MKTGQKSRALRKALRGASKRRAVLLACAVVVGAGGALGVGGCGGARGAEEPPVPALSGSPAAQAELRALLQRFAGGAREERVALRPALEGFRRRHPRDPLARVAEAHLAWIALDEGDLARAEATAAPLAQKEPGTTRDLAQVVQGAALRRRGRAREAYAALRPLVGKLIDSYVRALLNEEAVTAASDAGLWRPAIDLAGVWLRESTDDERPAAAARIAALIRKAPPEELVRQLRGRQAAVPENLPAAEVELRRLLSERLAMVARERKDARLAQELLATSGPLLGAQGDAVAQLAAGATRARVGAPTVGLLLSVRTPETRRRSVEAAAGVAFGLGLLGQSDRALSPVRLVSRDDGAAEDDRTAEALTSLSAEGAAVLIGGFDRGQATAAAAFARSAEMPVLLLHPPDPGIAQGPFVFVLGEDPARVSAALVAALAARGARPAALVAAADALGAASKPAGVAVALSCDGPVEERTLRLAGVQALAITGGSSCAERALEAAGNLGLRVALGLETGSAAPAGALVATAGRFPFSTASTDAALAPWLKAHSTPPGWWAALGRDAGVLARSGVEGLPARGTEDPAEVKARRRTAAEAVARAEATLWTTEAKGFGGTRALPRTLGAREAAEPAGGADGRGR